MNFLIIFHIISLTQSEKSISNFNNKIKKNLELESFKIKSMSRVEAVAEEESFMEEKNFSFYSKKYFKKLFSFQSPLNKCIADNCQYCCLSLNICGSKEQCENSNKTTNILKIIFFLFSLFLVLFLVFKIYITDPENEHTDSDKINDNALNLLISLYIHNKENREKFKQ